MFRIFSRAVETEWFWILSASGLLLIFDFVFLATLYR